MKKDLRRASPMCVALAFSLFLALAPGEASADRGSIALRPNVKLYEPNQRAIIAWDGRREILLLSTDLRASSPTRILEVLPLPARPKVKKGSVRSFFVATQIINQYRLRQRRFNGGSRGRGPRRRAVARPAGRVVLQKKIGSHHISVTEVLDGRRFVAWVQRYLKTRGYGRAHIPRPLRQVVEEYIRDGFRWFVFDIVKVGRQAVTTDAIEYSFASRRLYYPLRITRTETGWTRIKLIILTPYLFANRNFVGLAPGRVTVPHDPVPISGYQLRSISRGMYALMKRYGTFRLRIWQISGYLDRFRRDLLCTADRYRAPPRRSLPRSRPRPRPFSHLSR